MKILITGANRGLGYYLTRYALENGHTVFAGIKSLKQASEQLSQLKEQFGGALRLTEIDVSSEKSVMEAADQIKSETDAVDIVINNAGILLEKEKFIEELDMEKVLLTFEVNTFGPMRVVKHFLPLIRSGEDPAIINISSEAGSIVSAHAANYPYSMSKTALNMFTERLSDYLKDTPIRVYAVHPGWMRTDMGGANATGDPQDTVKGIFRIIERKINIHSKIAFINFNGHPMPL